MMSGRKLTFSRKIKDELCKIPCERDCCRKSEIIAAIFGAARLAQDAITLFTAHTGSAHRLAGQISICYGETPSRHNGLELISLKVSGPATVVAIQKDLNELVSAIHDSLPGQTSALWRSCCRQAVLRGLFLACGSVSDPSAGYHLELSLRRPEAADSIIRLLSGCGIRTGVVHRSGHDVIYLKDGQQIADFLLISGAHQCLLAFESLRVEKEMRNSVNRMVNCDSANTQRIADTAARQLELIRQLSLTRGLSQLQDDLRAAAEARLENPDLSLRELGESMQPPLGKSGMNHRLRRLEKAAAELLGERRISNDD